VVWTLAAWGIENFEFLEFIEIIFPSWLNETETNYSIEAKWNELKKVKINSIFS